MAWSLGIFIDYCLIYSIFDNMKPAPQHRRSVEFKNCFLSKVFCIPDLHAIVICSRRRNAMNLSASFPDLCSLISLSLPQHITKFLQRAPIQLCFLPQIRRQEAVCVSHSGECSFECVFEGLCRAGGGGVDVLDAGELEETLDGWGGDESGATGSGDELYPKVNNYQKRTL